MIKYGIITHGGVGSLNAWSDGCKTAAEKGFEILKNGGNALDAVIEAAVSLENDGRFDAGIGSVLRLDGKTIECDAALMTSTGKIGTVINVHNVKNPVLLARKVMDTPHVTLAGTGAENFAKKLGLHDKIRPTKQVKEQYKEQIQQLKLKTLDGHRSIWNKVKLENIWNCKQDYSSIFGCDTIGTVAIDTKGRLAIANSTGGVSPALPGRVGDSPIPGCGFYCTKHAAVVATGHGEEIIRRMLSFTIHNLIVESDLIEIPVKKCISKFPEEIPVGTIAISKKGYVIAANKEMASYALVEED
ncbi:MAG: isoaspartyl peptidase/L-asparaginase [Planctomycetes bacterium]|nr:isoaspartyl peptidase/L-asparaginase [Planctomycetota bacterium]